MTRVAYFAVDEFQRYYLVTSLPKIMVRYMRYGNRGGLPPIAADLGWSST